MVGTLFGNRPGGYFITGVTFSDEIVHNNFYEIGEQLGDVVVTAVRNGTGESFSVSTGPSGGYSLQVPDGTYTLTALGNRIRQAITVTDVSVAGRNEKVDFNLRAMSTGTIGGRVFQDGDGDGQQDAGEQGLAGHTVYLDRNDNARLDPDETTAITSPQGVFQFVGLRPGEYVVRQTDPNGWRDTTSGAGFSVTLSGPNDPTDLRFAVQEHDDAPIASPDAAQATSGRTVTIVVLANDVAVHAAFVPASLRITSAPLHGTVLVDSVQGTVTFVPALDFVGLDRFLYAVSDSV
jgi:uncharacterized protein (DUF2141 family)